MVDSDLESLADIAARQQAGRPTYFDDPEKDRLLALLIELAEEVCVQRDRVDTATELSARGEQVSAEVIDSYQPSPQEVAERLERHRALFVSLFERLS